MTADAAAADAAHMAAALGLARRGLGRVWPNPAVGCILVKDGHVVGRGWTQPGGRPHAETEALRRAGPLAAGATAYVTLEPCSHHGRTPPCADALIAAGIVRVVAAIEDPDSRVSGAGLAALRAAGIAVTEGVRAEEAAAVNAGFFMRVRAGRPLVTLKLASTLDGRIATAAGESRWITGPAARAEAHRLRAENDAILIGIGTALADDPDLDCRLPGMADRSPVRVVVDGQGRLPRESRLARSAGRVPVWLVTGQVGEAPVPDVDVVAVAAGADGRPDPAALMVELGRRGLTRVLVEGGGVLAAALLKAGLVDRLAWFHAPLLIGGDGRPAVAALGLDHLADAPKYRRTTVGDLGADVLSWFERQSSH